MSSAVVQLANITLNSPLSYIHFSNINSTYNDIRIIINGTITSLYAIPRVIFNNDVGTTYSSVYIGTDVFSIGQVFSGTGSASNSALPLSVSGCDTSTPSLITIDIMDYSKTNKYKPVLVSENTVVNGLSITAGRWSSTSAIHTISLSCNLGNFASGTTVAIYGIIGE